MVVGNPNLVEHFGPRLRLWTCVLYLYQCQAFQRPVGLVFSSLAVPCVSLCGKARGSEEGGGRRRKEKESCFKTKERERKSESQCNKGRYTCEHHPGPKVIVDNGQLCFQTPPWVARKLHGPKVNWKKRWSSYRRPITYLFMFFTPCNSHLLIGPGGLRAQCVRNACAMRAQCVRHAIVRSSSFFFSFFLRFLLLTHFGESPVCENLFPPIFWNN